MIELVTMLAGVALFPVLGLAFLLWMARLEDSLPDAVRRAGRVPDPPPILAIPVTPPRASAGRPLVLPAQRQASEATLSTAPSLGGSTNR